MRFRLAAAGLCPDPGFSDLPTERMAEEEASPAEAAPASRPVVRIGTPVASQQSRMLRADSATVHEWHLVSKHLNQ